MALSDSDAAKIRKIGKPAKGNYADQIEIDLFCFKSVAIAVECLNVKDSAAVKIEPSTIEYGGKRKSNVGLAGICVQD